jgi:mannosyltransferase OCH1-like enzyme
MIDRIPKIIHQVFGLWDNKMPKEIKRRIDKWKKLHPTYEYKLWDKKACKDFLRKKYNWFLPLYESYQYHVQRADAIRYFILYEYGGIYADIDLEPAKPLDIMLEKYGHKNSILYRSPNSDMITNDFMMSKPKNIFWKKVIYNLISKHNFNSISRHLTIMYSTGPLFLDDIYENYSKKRELIYIINTKYVNNCDVTITKPAKNKEAFLIRHDGRAWHSFDSIIIDFFIVNSKYILTVIIILILILLFKKKSKN